MGAGPVTISLDENFQQVGSDIAPMYSMHSRSGAEYDVAYFQRDDWKDVSAVIWSSELMPEKGDISLLFNPNATLPLTPEDIGIEGLNYISYTRTETGFSRDQPLS